MAFFQSKTLWVNQLADGVAVLVLETGGERPATLDVQVLSDLEEALERIERESRFELLVLRSARNGSFCHGLDVSWLSSLYTAEEFVALARRGQALCDRLAGLRLPSVAVIAGPCLGAGLELALACDYRVAVDQPSTIFALPQPELGLIPAWGGIWRLVRLVGLENSLRLLLGARRLAAREAYVWGLVDEIAGSAADPPPAFLAQPRKRDWTHFQRRSWRQHLLEATRPGWQLLLRGARRVVRERLPEGMPAPGEALESLRLARDPSPVLGLEHEQQALGRLGVSTACRNLLALQQQRERQRLALARFAADDQPEHPAFLGATATAFALLMQAIERGQQVVLRGQDEHELGAALLQLLQRLQAKVQQGELPAAQLDRCLAAVRGTHTWVHFDAVDLVLDLTASTLANRRALWQSLVAHAPAGALLVPGSASQTVAALQEGIADPGRVAGLYFVKPLERGSVVEVVRTPATLPETERRLVSWSAALGYTPVPVTDRPGRLVLRILLPALNEAALLVREGMAIAQVDAALRRFGLAQGPLEYADLLGVDVVAELAAALQPIFAGRLTFESGFERMAQRGWHGMKTELGFYRYRSGKRTGEHTEAEKLWQEPHPGEPSHGLPALSVPDQTRVARDRLVALMLLEAARCLEDRVVRDADALDLALCQTFWPPHQGGPCRYAQAQDAAVLAAGFAHLEQAHGARFHLPGELAAILGHGSRPGDG